jgi:negative regulator of sigma E activity
MVVDVDLDGAGNITAITAVDAQQLAKERLNQFSGVAQQQGKQVAEMAKVGVGALAARMGKVPLIAAVAACVAWFFLPAGGLNLGFLGSKSLTFWELLAIDLL